MPGSRTRLILLVATLIGVAVSAGAQETPQHPLFASHEPMELTIVADFKRLLSRKGWSQDRWYDATIQMHDPNGVPRSIAVRLKVRSGFRTRDDNCYFPQFFVAFTSDDRSGTAFAGQRVLPLTTHCRGSSTYSRYVHREYIAYRLYNLLSPKSLRVRNALITYLRSDKPVKVAKRHAFFVEHFDDLAARLDARRVELDVFHPVAADALEMGVLELFEFMIGNTDWSAAYQHNILLIQEEGKRITGIPYDFDFSGLVNAEYAAPGEQFRVRSVRTRIYRGWCREEADLQRVVDYFQEKRPEVFAMLSDYGWMPGAVVKDATQYLESFYKVLDSPKELDKQIRSKCASGNPVRPD